MERPHVFLHGHARACSPSCTHMLACIHVRAHTHTYTHTHLYTHTLTHTHTHTHCTGQAVLAETSTVKADSIAAAAMKAAETAVMEEMQAAAVVKVGGSVRLSCSWTAWIEEVHCCHTWIEGGKLRGWLAPMQVTDRNCEDGGWVGVFWWKSGLAVHRGFHFRGGRGKVEGTRDRGGWAHTAVQQSHAQIQHVRTHACTHAHAHTHTHTITHTHTHTHARTHAHMRACTCRRHTRHWRRR